MNFQITLLTLVFAIALFLFFVGAISLGTLFGKKRDKCSCMAAKRVMREYAARQKAAKNAGNYDPKSIDPSSLPVLSLDITPKNQKR